MECRVTFILVTAALWLRGAQTLALSDFSNTIDSRDAQDFAGPPRTEESRHCPGYFPGVNINSRPLDGCRTGSAIGRVDHLHTFGFGADSDYDLRLCDLPEYPEINGRVCYRTTIDFCDPQYRLYLTRRNFNGLLKNCPNEREDLHASHSEVIFPSPRYQCQKRNGRFYRYRNKELCLYNISVPNCDSGRVFIQQVENKPNELEERIENGECVDYLQFFYDSSEGNSVKRTSRFCGTELSEQSHIPLPTTNFLALFWTDTQHNSEGFDLRAICQPSSKDSANSGSGSGGTSLPSVK